MKILYYIFLFFIAIANLNAQNNSLNTDTIKNENTVAITQNDTLSFSSTSTDSTSTLKGNIFLLDNSKPIIMEGDNSFPPYEFINEKGEPDGFHIDLFKEIMQVLGLKYEIRLKKWDESVNDLKKQEIDMITGMTFTHERSTYALFSIPHGTLNLSIISKEEHDYKSINDILTKKLILQVNDAVYLYVISLGLKDQIIPAKDLIEAFHILAKENDAVMIGNDIATHYLAKKLNITNLKFHIVPEIEPICYNFAINKNKPELLYAVNYVLYNLIENGTYNRIYQKWFAEYQTVKADTEETDKAPSYFYTIWPKIAIIGFIIILLFYILSYRYFKNKFRILQLAKEHAEKSDAMKSAFLANMSHEIRTPLNAIVGFSRILVNATTEEEKESYLKIIESNNTQLLQLISDILDLSRIESGNVEIHIEDFPLDDVCKNVHASMLAYHNLGPVKLLLDLNCPCIVNSDRNRITQVISNFINNATKYTTEGSITLRTERQGSYVEVQVIDTGKGIEKEKLDSIFNRFVKLNEQVKGTGLGLAISKGLIEHLDGQIGVRSQTGVGSCFWFRLKIKEFL